MRHVIDLGRRSPSCTAGWHGTVAAYRAGCQCPHAREQDRLYKSRHRYGLLQSAFVNRAGTMRRLRALRVQGWRSEDIAARLDITHQVVSALCEDSGRPVNRTTAAKVAAVTRQLADQPGPSRVAAARARARGWVSIAEWDDIDDPAAEPCPVPPDDEPTAELVLAGGCPWSSLSQEADRLEVVRLLATQGLTAARIAYRVGTSKAVISRLLDGRPDGRRRAA